MDKLPDSLLLQILSRLSDSADVARCRVASKAFNSVFPGLRSINLRCSSEWYINSTSKLPNSSTSQHIKPFRTIFLDLISKLEAVESVCIGLQRPFLSVVDPVRDDFYFTDADFAKEWLPRVSGSLKTLSISDHHMQSPSSVLPLISSCCHNLVNLKLELASLSVHHLNPMAMLTSLKLEYIRLEDEHLSELNKFFPNLQALNLVGVGGLEDPKIHHLTLKTCIFAVYEFLPSLTLITPNLVTLRIECVMPAAIHVKAPMVSHFHLGLNPLTTISRSLVEFLNPENIVEHNLTLDSGTRGPIFVGASKFILEKVFEVFPNVSSLCMSFGAWSELEACLNPEGWEGLDGRKGLKRICAYLMLDDPSLTFAAVACVLDRCVGLSEVLLLIHDGDVGLVSQSFMSKCMTRWPGLKWRWGIWREGKDDSWMVDGTSVVDESNEFGRGFVRVSSFEFDRPNKRARTVKRTKFHAGSFEKDVCLCSDKLA
ncbi:hypothetical protein SSX86_008424 [Deinandra increscens subsp. villosa]|uniref:F-box domain-containing protein n=1 Tax=Deinandra increscens subsp. villosa TaxID=3103831 RepID=A0AAP0DJ35_9ASTR